MLLPVTQHPRQHRTARHEPNAITPTNAVVLLVVVLMTIVALTRMVDLRKEL